MLTLSPAALEWVLALVFAVPFAAEALGPGVPFLPGGGGGGILVLE